MVLNNGFTTLNFPNIMNQLKDDGSTTLSILAPGDGLVPGTEKDRPISLGNLIGNFLLDRCVYRRVSGESLTAPPPGISRKGNPTLDKFLTKSIITITEF